MDNNYSLRIQKIEDVLGKWLPESPDTEWARMVFPGLKKIPADSALRYLTMPDHDLLSRGGKRWRPLLMTLACEALGGGEAALSLSPLVEFSHNASLIHDDIEDNSDRRRGRPSVHLLYGVDTAINSGCFLYFLSISCIDAWAAEIESEYGASAEIARNKAYALWGEYMRRLHLGQSMDISWHRDFSSLPSIDEYHLMCAMKTGCLARFAAVMGVCAASSVVPEIGEKEKDIADTLGDAAEKLGIGFQILDDVKNLTTGIPGKHRGDDIVEGKKSLPVLLFLHRYPERQDDISKCFIHARADGITSPAVEEAIHHLEKSGVIAEAEAQGRALIEEARKVFALPSFGSNTLLAGLVEILHIGEDK